MFPFAADDGARPSRLLPRFHPAVLAILVIAILPMLASRFALAQNASGSGSPALLGALAPTDPVSISIVLPLRNQDALADLIARQYDPSDPLYGKYLKPAEFADRFGPTESDVDAVKAFAARNGFAFVDASPNRTVVKFATTDARAEAAFGVRLCRYSRTDGTEFHAPDRAPTLPKELAGKVLAVLGLDTSLVSHHDCRLAAEPGSSPAGIHTNSIYGSGYEDCLIPSDIATIYDIDTTASGRGQTVGLYEECGWTQSDIETYQETYYPDETSVVWPAPVSVDGGTSSPSSVDGAAETTLDIDMVLATAPSVSNILVYEAPSPTSAQGAAQECVDILNRMATDDEASVISSSYSFHEEDVKTESVTYGGSAVNFLEAENQIFEQMAAQGQTMCAASGDSGAYDDQALAYPNVGDPGSQPYVLGVGGTNIADTTGESYIRESSWADTADKNRGAIGTGGGGGISSFWSIPSYQAGAFSTAVNKQGSTTYRNVPDVSLYGDFDTGYYSMYLTIPGTSESGWNGANGTSAASPLWAGFLADVNEERAEWGYTPIGFANPIVYKLAEDPAIYAADFHDIADGTNNLFYKTVAGYDNSTGWGSFIGTNLLADLVSVGAGFPNVQSVSFNLNPAAAGAPVTGTITLGAPALSAGAAIAIAQGSTSVGTVTVPAGSTTATFTPTDTSVGSFTYTASYDGSSATGTLTVTPAVSSLAFNPNPAYSAFPTVGTVALTAPAPAGGAVVAIELAGATVQACAIAAGSTTSTFTITPAAAGSFVYTAAYNGSSVSSTLTVTAPPPLAVQSLSFNPNPITVNESTTGTVVMNLPAPKGGAAVKITLAGAAVKTVTVPAGKPSVAFTLTEKTAGALNYVATYKKSTATATLTVKPLAVASLAFNPNPVAAGVATTGTVTLNGPAGASGAAVAITKAGAKVKTVTIPAGAETSTFALTAAAPGSYAYKAAYNGSSATATLSVTPDVASLAFNPGTVARNVATIGTVTLSAAAPTGGATVAIALGSTAIATATVPAGATSATFSTSSAVTGALAYTATYHGSSATATLTVTPDVSSLAFNPNPVIQDLDTTGTVTLDGPAPTGGASVTVTQAGQSVATVAIAAGAATGTFTLADPASGTLAYSAAYNGSNASASLTVTPVTISGFSFSPTTVSQDVAGTGTITLTAPAPAGGASIAMTLSGTTVATVAIPAGSTSGVFSPADLTAGTFAYSASYNGSSATASLTVTPLAITSLSFNPDPAPINQAITGTVTLSGPAPAGGATVPITQGNTAVTTCAVPAGSATGTFTMTVATIESFTPYTAAYNGSSYTAYLTTWSGAPITVSSVALYPNPCPVNTAPTCEIYLSGPAPATGAPVVLTCNGVAVGTYTISPCETRAQIELNPIASSGTYTYTAGYNGSSASTVLTVNNTVTLTDFAFNPTSIVLGTSSTGTVTINTPAPTGGISVTIAVGKATSTLTIPAGQTSASFTVQGQAVGTYNYSATYTYTSGSTKISQSMDATLTVT